MVTEEEGFKERGNPNTHLTWTEVDFLLINVSPNETFINLKMNIKHNV